MSTGHADEAGELQALVGRLEARNRELQQANERFQRLNAVLRAIRNLTRLIIKEEDPEVLAQGACETLTRDLSYAAAWITLLKEGAQEAVTATAGLDSGMEALRERLARGERPDCVARALAADEVVIVAEPRLRCGSCPLAEACGDRSGLVRRLHHSGDTFGVLAVSVPAGYARDAEEQALFDEMARDLAFALHRIEISRRLRAASAEVERYFSASLDLLCIADTDGRFLRLNPEWERTLGYPVGALENRRFLDLVHPDDLETTRQAVALLATQETLLNFENRYRHRDGSYRWIEWRSIPQGRLIYAAARDVTERKRVEAALRESEARFRSYVEHAPYGVFITDRAGRYLEINPAAAQITGYSEAALKRMSVADFLPAEGGAAGRDHFRRLVETGHAVGELPYLHAGGAVRFWTVSATRLSDDRFLGFVEDVTDRRRREERIALLSRMLDEAPAAITIHGTDGRFLFANRQTLRLHGYDDEQEFLSINLHELDVPESELLLAERFRRIAEEGEARFEAGHYRKDGSSFPLEVLAKSIDWHGRPAILSIAADITERKRVEAALRESEGRFRQLVESAPMSVLLLQDGKYIYGNPAGLRLLGFEKSEDLIGLRALDTIPPELHEEVLRRMQRIEAGAENPPFQLQLLRRTGERVWSLSTSVPVMMGGKPTAIIVGQDITAVMQAELEREQLRAQLAQSQKMESVGRLAGGVAHDFNNMLGVILGHAEMTLALVPPDHPIHAGLAEIRAAAARSAELTRQLLAFARRQTVTPRVLDLNDAVASVLKMLERLIGEQIDLVWRPAGILEPVRVDPAQIDQVLANLCVNARDAIGRRTGRIVIETGMERLDAANSPDLGDAGPGDYALLAVSDDGCGMDEATRAKIFEPFFTTKGVGEGTGLGLATVYGIVQQNRGIIRVFSSPGAGTTFRIYLPAHRAPRAERERAAGGPVAPERGHETVLLVEDEPAVNQMVHRMLELLGYQVLAAATPGEALRRAREYDGTIHLLVSDVVMPEMNGRDLARALEAIRPGIRRLFISGHTDDVIAHQGVLDETVHFLQKPFSRAELALKVREALES